MKTLRTYIAVLAHPILLLFLIAAGVFGFFHTAPAAVTESAVVSVSAQDQLPPLSPVQEDNSGANGVLRGVLPGTLPPVLVSRRNGEQLRCRIMRDGSADLAADAPVAIQIQFQCIRPEFVRFEFHLTLKTSLPPRAGPAMV